MTGAYDSSTISATAVVDALHVHGITHAVWLPDSETNFMHVLLTEDDSIRLVPVCREGETMAIAAGLWIGGKKPVVMIQNTGVFESGDSIRAMSLDTGMPLVMMIGYRGWTRHGATPDSAARYIEPVLDAFGINYYLVEQAEDMERISMAFSEAEETNRPVALLMGREFGE
ncbi:MAG: thiamine pyrophosphate-binding protein [Chloroflexi bacterium]|nr:thiamine pyrophosphate-binding protein [Chloroflexota bacterium]